MKFFPSFKLNINWTDLLLLFKNLFLNNNANTSDYFKKYIKNKYVIEVPSSRWGLFFLLKALNLERNSEIIIPAYTYFAVPSAVIRADCIPVFVDIEKNGINIDPNKIESAITRNTKAIIATHLCGLPCDLDKIKEISEKYNLIIIEDCAQAFGAKYNNDFVGNFSKASYYSFSITKNLTTLRGGIIATDDELIASKIKLETDKMLSFTKMQIFTDFLKAMIMKIATSKIITPFTCMFFYLFSLAKIDIAKMIFKEKAILLPNSYPKYGNLNHCQKKLAERQLKNFDDSCNIKQKNGELFYKLLQNTKDIETPKFLNNCKNIFSGMPIFIKNKEITRIKLLTKGIDTSTGFVQNCTDIDEFKQYIRFYCPNASRAEKELLYFISSDSIKNQDIKYIANILKKL